MLVVISITNMRKLLQNWIQLYDDLREIGQNLVSLALVTDPFGNYSLPELQTCFQDILFPFKQHFVIDLRVPQEHIISPHHRRNVRKACQVVDVEWYVQDGIGYYHLGAYSSLGYDLRASFALFAFAIDYFVAEGLQWLNLGSGPGLQNSQTDGLSRFKGGWATGTRSTYFCGRIFAPARYAYLVKAKGDSITKYFPAYRTKTG